jgi:hypothetical protein
VAHHAHNDRSAPPCEAMQEKANHDHHKWAQSMSVPYLVCKGQLFEKQGLTSTKSPTHNQTCNVAPFVICQTGGCSDKPYSQPEL